MGAVPGEKRCAQGPRVSQRRCRGAESEGHSSSSLVCSLDYRTQDSSARPRAPLTVGSVGQRGSRLNVQGTREDTTKERWGRGTAPLIHSRIGPRAVTEGSALAKVLILASWGLRPGGKDARSSEVT